jgi:hypothetical protein
MTRTPIATLAAALLSAAALSVPAQTVRAEQEIDVTQTRDTGSIVRPAIDTLRGIVASIDQSRDTITIRLSSGRTEQFKVQDGLIFDAVRYGDQVEVSVQTIAGTETIISLH